MPTSDHPLTTSLFGLVLNIGPRQGPKRLCPEVSCCQADLFRATADHTTTLFGLVLITQTMPIDNGGLMWWLP